MMTNDKPPLLVLGPEIAIHQALFEETPLNIVAIYLQCFNSTGEQVRGIPQHVLEAVAKRFLAFMTAETSSLDLAFGGKVATQRKRLRKIERDRYVQWTYLRELEKAKSIPRAKRAGTPSEIAEENTAKRFKMSPDNIRLIRKG